jgi:hypothetical protein
MHFFSILASTSKLTYQHIQSFYLLLHILYPDLSVASNPETLPMTPEEDAAIEGSKDIIVEEEERVTSPMVIEESSIQCPTTPSAKSFASAFGVLALSFIMNSEYIN